MKKLSESDIKKFTTFFQKKYPKCNLKKIKVFTCKLFRIPLYLYLKFLKKQKVTPENVVSGFVVNNTIFFSDPYPLKEKSDHFVEKTFIHEIVHCCQYQNLGLTKFLCRHFRENCKFGFRKMYTTPGTLEFEAEEMSDEFYKKNKID